MFVSHTHTDTQIIIIIIIIIQTWGIWMCWNPGYCSTASSLKAKLMAVSILLEKDFSFIYVLFFSGETNYFGLLR
jgi:hypothetical protein